MRIYIQAKPDAYEDKIEKIDETHFVILVKEPPIKGLANRAIGRLLAEHFNTSPSRIRLISGFSSRQKVFEIDEAYVSPGFHVSYSLLDSCRED